MEKCHWQRLTWIVKVSMQLLIFLQLCATAPGSDQGCRDKNSACSDWSSQGECNKNPGFMNTSCPVSCGVCTPRPLDPKQYVGERLIMKTDFGDIRIKLRFDNAPNTCALVMDLAHAGACEQCRFYRNEDAPTDGSGGPPYGLLQGSLAGMLRAPPHEGTAPPVYGTLAMITGTTEFYISTMDHSSWGTAHTVWGQVENMDVVERIVKQSAFHEFKHPQYGTVMRMMNQETKFILLPQAEQAPATEEEDL